MGSLLVLVLVVVGIMLALSSGGGSTGRTKTVSLEAGRSYADRVCLEENRRHQIAVTSELSDPQAEIEITVYSEDLSGRRNTIATNRARGRKCSVNFASPGFGEVPFYVMNHGPGSARCTITHDGLKNPNWP